LCQTTRNVRVGLRRRTRPIKCQRDQPGESALGTTKQSVSATLGQPCLRCSYRVAQRSFSVRQQRARWTPAGELAVNHIGPRPSVALVYPRLDNQLVALERLGVQATVHRLMVTIEQWPFIKFDKENTAACHSA
jgi:hypothetical protein